MIASALASFLCGQVHHLRRKAAGQLRNCPAVLDASRHPSGWPHNHDIHGSTTPLISFVNAKGE
jgi:hypothetical protein